MRPKKWRPLNLGLIGRQKRFFARVPGGKTGTKAATSSARRGALAICDVTASATYHIACDANMNIASRDTMAQNRPHHERLVTAMPRGNRAFALRLQSQAQSQAK